MTSAVIDAIPTLLVLSVVGLILFIYSVNLVVAGVILGVFVLFALVYQWVTISPPIWVIALLPNY